MNNDSYRPAVLYIHGYGSDGNATKGRLLRAMLVDCRVVTPTFDYIHSSPWHIQQQLQDLIRQHQVRMLVGSSFGGYHALCATEAFHGPVWVINPVRDVVATIRRIASGWDAEAIERYVLAYADFDRQCFRPLSAANRVGQWPADTPLNFALSTDDELLGDHHPLLDLFPHHDQVVWKDNCGHRFIRFEELNLL